jgi:hypothetical protein
VADIGFIINEVESTQILTVGDGSSLASAEAVIELLEVVQQGLPGPQGLPGNAGASYLTYPAGQVISGHRVMKTSGGSAFYASASTPGDANLMLGISLNAAMIGDPVNIQYSGEIVEPSWAWIPDQVIFCGVDGALTQTAPSGVQTIVAVASAPTKIVINISRPIITN